MNTAKAKKIVICNKKGGVGKTTTTQNTAAILAEMGYRVLAVDLDSQANLTASFGLNMEELSMSMNNVFLGRHSLSDIAIEINRNLFLAPARPDLEKTMNMREISCHGRRYEILKFNMGDAEAYFDFILIDTPTSADSLLGMNGLSVSDYSVIPLILDRYSLIGVRQVHSVMSDVHSQWLNKGLKSLGILVTQYQQNRTVSKKYLSIFHDSIYGATLFNTKIRHNAAIPGAASKGLPLSLYDTHSAGYEDYYSFTHELLERVYADKAA